MADLPNYSNNIGALRLRYGHLTETGKYAGGTTIVCGNMTAIIAGFDPETGTPNKCLRFDIAQHPTPHPDITGGCYDGMNDDDPDVLKGERGRVQSELYFGDPQLGMQGLKNVHYSNQLFIPNDFAWMLNEPADPVVFNSEYKSMIIGELFNITDFEPYLGDNFRINYSLHKLAGETRFRIQIKGEPRVPDPTTSNPNNTKWGDPTWVHISEPIIGLPDDDMALAQLSHWMKMDVFFLEEDATLGTTDKIVIKINDVAVLDVNDFTHHPDDVTVLDGLKHLNPQKLYVNAVITREFNLRGKQLHLYWDDFMIERDFNLEEHDIICPISAGCVSLDEGEVGRDADETDAGVLINDDDLDLHDKHVGLQFTGMTIPQNATVIDAYVQFESKLGGEGEVATTIFGERLNQLGAPGGNPFSFADTPQGKILPRIGQTTTVGSEYWNILPWASGDDRTYHQRTPNLNTIVQDIMGSNGGEIEADNILSFLFRHEANEDGLMRAAKSVENGEDEASQFCASYDYLAFGNIKTWSLPEDADCEENEPSCAGCRTASAVPGILMQITVDDDSDGVFDDDPCGLGETDYYNAIPDPSGNYRQRICPVTSDYEITPFKEHDLSIADYGNFACGVSTYDLVKITQHILETEPFIDVHQRIAADVNNSGHVTTIDVVHGRKVILFLLECDQLDGFIPWKFHDASVIFPPLTNNNQAPFPTSVATRTLPGPDNSVNFEVIKTIDVNCSCDTETLEPLAEEDVNILIEDVAASQDEIFDVAFKVENFADIQAYQLGIEFDAEKLEYLDKGEADLNEGADTDNFGLCETDDGKVKTVWLKNDASDANDMVMDTTLVDSSTIFVMTFRAKEDITSLRESETLSKLLRLNDKLLKNEAYSEKGIHSVKMKYLPEGTFADLRSDEIIQEVNCFPNPAINEVTFQLKLGASSKVSLQIFDPLGKVVSMQEVSLTAGTGFIHLDKLKDWNDGLYFYTITAEDSVFSGKFVKE